MRVRCVLGNPDFFFTPWRIGGTTAGFPLSQPLLDDVSSIQLAPVYTYICIYIYRNAEAVKSEECRDSRPARVADRPQCACAAVWYSRGACDALVFGAD